MHAGGMIPDPGRERTLVITVRRIGTDDPLYTQEVELRESVLLRPVGLDLAGYVELTGRPESDCEHFVAIAPHTGGERVVGAATLVVPSDPDAEAFGKVQQVCVDPQRQGEGIGTRVMIAIEARAFVELGLPGLYCHAQLTAMAFYERLGWRAGSDVFLEAGIEHKRMEIEASKPGLVDPDRARS